MLTITVALLTALAALLLAGRPAAMVLAAVAAALLLVGGGFVPALTAALAAAAAAPLRVARHPPRPAAFPTRPPRALRWSAPRLAHVWPWALAAFVLWGLGGWWHGGVANDVLVKLGGATFLLDLGLPMAVVVSARARAAWTRRP